MSYEQSASVYDAIYTQMKDYRREAERLYSIVENLRRSGGWSLLDVACGTGLHAEYLSDWYLVEGLDISEAQLAIARKRLPKRPFYHDDMRTFNLGRQYDVVTCLFSAIGHLTSREMPVAVANMARHLKPGGVLVIEPWLQPHMWRPGYIGADFVDRPDLKVARISRSTREGNVIKLVMDHLVGRLEGTEHFVERFDLTMIGLDGFRAAFAHAGLEFSHDPDGLSDNGRGLFIGRKLLV